MSKRKQVTRSVPDPAEPPAAEPRDPARAASADGPGARAHWRQLLAGSSSREVLARLFQGDPLRLRDLAAEVLRDRAYVLDVGRVYLRGLAYVARFAVRYRGQPDLAVWLRERVDEAVLDLLTEDRERARDEGARAPAVYGELARPLALDAGAMWRVTVAFNARNAAERRAFYDWILDGGDLDELARGQGVSPTRLARDARAVLDALLRVESAALAPREDST